MTLKERLAGDMKSAMKAREAGRARLSVIQLTRAAILQIEKDKQVTLDDAGVLDVLAREAKQRQEALVEYERLGATEAVERLKNEIHILREYMPQQLTEEQVRQIADEVITALGASGPRDMGKVMGQMIQKTRGQADGKLVNQIVKEMLEKSI